MKVLFANAAESATITAPNESLNYPASNLVHRILKKRYQSVINEDTIRLEWSAAVVVNCLYVGYTNASAFTLRLYDASAALLATVALSPADMAAHFAAVSGVRAAEIDLEVASGAVYLGGIGIGEEYTMPDPRNDWTDGHLDNSNVEISADGQVFANRIEPLRSLPLNFFTIGFEAFREIRDLIVPISRAVPVWLDVFETWHAEALPLYGTIELSKSTKRDHVIDFSLNVQEAR